MPDATQAKRGKTCALSLFPHHHALWHKKRIIDARKPELPFTFFCWMHAFYVVSIREKARRCCVVEWKRGKRLTNLLFPSTSSSSLLLLSSSFEDATWYKNQQKNKLPSNIFIFRKEIKSALFFREVFKWFKSNSLYCWWMRPFAVMPSASSCVRDKPLASTSKKRRERRRRTNKM